MLTLMVEQVCAVLPNVISWSGIKWKRLKHPLSVTFRVSHGEAQGLQVLWGCYCWLSESYFCMLMFRERERGGKLPGAHFFPSASWMANRRLTNGLPPVQSRAWDSFSQSCIQTQCYFYSADKGLKQQEVLLCYDWLSSLATLARYHL